MKFVINKLEWQIIELDSEDCIGVRKQIAKEQNEKIGSSFYYGFTNPASQTIYLNTLMCEQQKKQTLIHELVHAWLWSVGASYVSYTEDALCDTVSACYDFIQTTIEKYEKRQVNK